MLGRIIGIHVDADAECAIHTFAGRGNDDLFDRALQVGFGLFRFGKQPGGFHDDLGAKRAPVQLCRILFAEYLDRLVVHQKVAIFELHASVKSSQNGVIFQQVSKNFRLGDVVDPHDFDLGISHGTSDKISSNSSESVNGNFDRHGVSSKVYSLKRL